MKVGEDADVSRKGSNKPIKKREGDTKHAEGNTGRHGSVHRLLIRWLGYLDWRVETWPTRFKRLKQQEGFETGDMFSSEHPEIEENTRSSGATCSSGSLEAFALIAGNNTERKAWKEGLGGNEFDAIKARQPRTGSGGEGGLEMCKSSVNGN